MTNKQTRFLLLIYFLFSTFSVISQDKRALTHADYNQWNNLSNQQISDQGNWVSFEINPQEGDGSLWLYNVPGNDYKTFDRGYGLKFSPDEDFIAFQIKTPFDTIRQAKLDKKKEDDMPKDALGIYIFDIDSLLTIERVKSFKVPEENAAWMAYLLEKELAVKDTSAVSDTTIAEPEKQEQKTKGKNKKKDKKQDENTLVSYHPESGSKATFRQVSEYTFSKNGNLLSFLTTQKDSIDSVAVHVMLFPGLQSQMIYNGPGYAKSITCDEQGRQVAYLFSSDTGDVKIYDLYLWDAGKNKLQKVADSSSAYMPEGYCVSANGSLYFSENGNRLFFGTAEIPVEEAKDTLTDDEKVSVDIWNWKDDRLQPMQLKQLDRDKKRSYDAVYHIPLGRMVQLGDEALMNINMDNKHNGPYALGISYKPYYKERSWDADGYRDVYLVNVSNGERKLILEKHQSSAYLSPLGRYIAFYEEKDSSWNSFSVKSGDFFDLTADIPVCFAQEEFDMPTTPGPYGMKGWTKNEDKMLVYDRYDIWLLDPEGKEAPVNLTKGRKNEIKYRYIILDPDKQYIPQNEELLLSAFNEKNKDAGFYHLNISKSPEMEKIFMAPYRFYTPKKAKHADKLIWQRMNFREYPNLYLSDLNFENEVRLSDANPQQKDFLWGTVEMVEWTSADGIELEGLLYKPDGFNKDSIYPMIIYFYERYSNSLHAHYTPKPSRSTVNFTYYASNGYLIFVPDIVYKTGFPGQSAYNSVVSGALHLIENPWVDKAHIGIQGQSWGGYQVAYLVTQTNMFAAAMAGAPVSNMTSAYGGIRWGSGMSRMFQYEGSQSRIGGTLWEKPWRYIENSPVFFADKVETPLLIMHNDNDGAVPWYQGIELFVALRRLNKPVWMLTYNGAPHNLKRRADCKDLSIRMQQFFDHYLKGAAAPLWMEYGVPALEKGKEMGYELVK